MNALVIDAAAGEATESHAGFAAKSIVTTYGFWIFLISDFVMFSALFATFAVLVHATDGGPGPRELFDLRGVEFETAALLASSFTSGLAAVSAARERQASFQIAMLATGALGAIFLALEVREFAGLVAQGTGPARSAFLSAFFTLVGCHGLHVALGLLWLMTMMAQVYAKGFRADVQRRLLCFALFWHALDIIWVGLFTVVYLYGVYL